MKNAKLILIPFLIWVCGLSSAFAKPFPPILITESNNTLFWEVLPPKGSVITCYLKDGKRYPGKANTVVSGGAAGEQWKDTYRIKIQKLIKAKKDPAKAKKAYKAAFKLCKNSTPPTQSTPTPTPTPTPPAPVIECGNGLVEGGEICDDGNLINGDGCSNLCANELCGDTVVQPLLGEECDDGNATIGDGCSATCTVEGTVIPPGTGFSGPTSEPGPVGNPASAGYGAKVIAQWNTVPYQTFYDEMNVGVVAFHMNGIDRVEFAVNGGAWTAVTEMTENPTTSTVEYWVKLRASDLEDGVVEVRAIAYPTIGQPRLLESLFLNANGDGSLPNNIRYVSSIAGNDVSGDGSATAPFATIMKAMKAIETSNGNGLADGGSVYLLAGNYQLGTYLVGLNTTTANRWVTIRPAPGLSKIQVAITSTGAEGVKTKLVKIEDVTIRSELKTDATLTDYIWLSNCRLIGNGRDTVVGTAGFISPSSGWSDIYFTDSTLDGQKDGLAAKIVRNVALSNIGSDAFSGARLVVNSSVDDIDASGTMYTPDLVEFDLSGGNIENRIFYGISGWDVTANLFTADGGGTATLKDVAFVNVLHDYRPGEDILSSEWRNVILNHLLMWHVTSMQLVNWNTADSNLSNISIKNSAWLGMTVFGDSTDNILDSHDVSYNHYISDDSLYITPGTNVTTDDAGFTNAAGNDYTPTNMSALKDRSPNVVTGIDIDGNTRSSPVSIGAYE